MPISQGKRNGFEMSDSKPMIKIFLGCFLFAVSLFAAPPLPAAEYSLYVDGSAKDDGDGSKDDPFRKLSDAIEEAEGGDRIRIENGEYSGGFTVRNPFRFMARIATRRSSRGRSRPRIRPPSPI
jgi:hypothetical protein